MSESANFLSFSEDALSNRQLLLSDLNDVNIFVEDDGKEYVYETIFERLFGEQMRIFSVFPLGGKDAVLRKQLASEVYDKDRKLNFFIVDGDFDNLWDEHKITAPNLVYLDRYNIESYYCTEEATINYMRFFLKRSREYTKSLIHYEAWFRTFKEEFGKLFVLFAMAQHYCPGLPNVESVSKFLDASGRLIPERYQDFKAQIETKIGSAEVLVKVILERIQHQFHRRDDSKILSIVCGKCQIESLCRHLKQCCRKNINRDNMRNSLIMTFDLKPLQFMKEQILQLLMAEGNSQNRA